jgi:NADH:ubiquinone oxidoreductase subunit F (NADH-binding)
MVVADAVESEPASAKDRTLLALRPHLVLDGLQLAGIAVGAARLILYMSSPDATLVRTVRAAVAERRGQHTERPVEVATGPGRYVAGEETAIVARLDGNAAKPRTVPPRPFERGVGGRPTLVTNVETLAHAALIARRGAAWFRAAGSPAAPGTVLLTVSGAVRSRGVVEVTQDITVSQVLAAAGGATAPPQAILFGGYFGRWARAHAIWECALEPASLARFGLSLGAGVVAVLPDGFCGVSETARVLRFLADESAGQCGPCAVGLPALSSLFQAVSAGRADPAALQRLARWAFEIRGRGACRHPDGATQLLASALEVFSEEVWRHLRSGPCPAAGLPPLLPLPSRQGGWR